MTLSWATSKKKKAVKLEGFIFFTWKNSNSIYPRKSKICSYSIPSRRVHQYHQHMKHISVLKKGTRR